MNEVNANSLINTNGIVQVQSNDKEDMLSYIVIIYIIYM